MLERGYVIIIAGGILVTAVIVYQEYGLGLWPRKVKISNHCYGDKQIDSAIFVWVAIYIYFFYKENR